MPPRTVTIAITMATMGRRMKKAAMSVARRRARGRIGREGPGADLGPGRELSGVDDDAVAGGDAGLDDPSRSDPLAEGDGPDLHRVVGGHDPELRLALQVDHRALRHQQDVFRDPGVGADAAGTGRAAAGCSGWETSR